MVQDDLEVFDSDSITSWEQELLIGCIYIYRRSHKICRLGCNVSKSKPVTAFTACYFRSYLMLSETVYKQCVLFLILESTFSWILFMSSYRWLRQVNHVSCWALRHLLFFIILLILITIIILLISLFSTILTPFCHISTKFYSNRFREPQEEKETRNQ